MTVENTKNTIRHTGNGSVKSFPYDFTVISSGHMTVSLDGVLQGSGFTVTGLKDPTGGTVEFDEAPAQNVSVILTRVVPLTQLTDYRAFDAFPAQTHEDALDLLTMICQQLSTGSGRSLRVRDDDSVTDGGLLLPYPSDREGKVISFDSDGNAIMVPNGEGNDGPDVLVEEIVVLEDFQTNVTLSEVDPAFAIFYLIGYDVDQGRIKKDTDYVLNEDGTSIDLKNSYPQGTILYCLQNETEGGVPLVLSFNGRTGNVEPTGGDYSADQISLTSEDFLATDVEGALEELSGQVAGNIVEEEIIGSWQTQSAQDPTGLGIAGVIDINYGIGGDTSDGEFTMNNSGAVTRNSGDEQVVISLVLNFLRSGASGTSILVGRLMFAPDGVNFVQASSSFSFLIDDPNTTVRQEFNLGFNPPVGSAFKLQLARDPAGANSGGIGAVQPSGDISGWTAVNTAQLRLIKLRTR